MTGERASVRKNRLDDVREAIAPPVRRSDTTSPAAVAPAHGAQHAGSVGRSGGALSASSSSAVERLRGTGRPLEEPVRRRMEEGFGTSLSDVRVHDGPESARLNRTLSAKAFTAGREIFFGAGQYSPTTPDGERVLAHELAHTLQPDQLGAPVRRLWDAAAGVLRDDHVQGTDGQGQVIDVPRIKAETDVAVLDRWLGELEWDEETLRAAIEERRTELEGQALATKQAADTADQAAQAAAQAAQEAARKDAEKAAADARRREVEDAAGLVAPARLTNYDVAVHDDLDRVLENNGLPKKVRVGWFFRSAAAHGAPPATVLAQIGGDPVALEAFIYGNGMKDDGAASTTVDQARSLSALWAQLDSAEAAITVVDELCRQIKERRIVPGYVLYRKETSTSTRGSKFTLGRPDRARGLAKVEIHLHVGKKGERNNAALKVGRDGDRKPFSPGQYASVQAALAHVKQWRD